MKKLLFIAASVLALGAITATAALPAYKTYSTVGGANGSTIYNCTALIPADPVSQLRVVTIFYKSDTNTANFSFSTGQGAYYTAFTNGATSVTNFINTTNGLLNSAVVFLQQPTGLVYTNTISSYGNSGTAAFTGITNTVNGPNGLAGSQATNVSWIVLPTGGWGVVAAAGSDIYEMSTATTGFFVGASTNALNGDAIFVGNPGRPILATLTPPGVTNAISTISVRLDASN